MAESLKTKVSVTPDLSAKAVSEFKAGLKTLVGKAGPVKIDLDFGSKAKSSGFASQLEKEADAAGQRIEKLLASRAGGALKKMAFEALQKGLQGLYENVVALDGAMANLQIANGMKGDEVKALALRYSELGKSIGATTTELLHSAGSWSRQGYDKGEIDALVQHTTMLSKIGQVSADEAAGYLTSAMKGFNIQAGQSLQIVDKLSTVDTHVAVSMGELAGAMAQTAANAGLAGIGIDRLIGYIAAVGEATQGEMEAVGEGFKTMFARIGNLKAGHLLDPETGEDLSRVEATLSGLGISLCSSAEEFRSLGEVFDEVGGKWNDFTGHQQRSAAAALAGPGMQENFLALMQNYGKALEYTQISADSSGKALEKFGAYQESVAAKQAALTAAFEQFSMALLDSSTVKDFLDFLTGALSALTGLMPVLQSAPAKIIASTSAVAALSSALKSLGSLKLFQNIGSSLKGLGRPEIQGFTFRKLPHAS